MTIRPKRRSAQPSTTASQAVEGADGPSGINRRSFLVGGGAAAAMVGVAASVPGVTSAFGASTSKGSAEAANVAPATELEAASMSDPVVAHVKDVSTGEISIYSGNQEVVLRDRGLAAQLFRATR